MWLLDTTSLVLVYFVAPPAKYAILSHTWGDDEITFKEWRTTDISGRKGYQKISGFCTLAARDGYTYGWVDTCCIDKDSSAELSEAINSMYKWYEMSSLCYVYLSDVQVPQHLLPDEYRLFPPRVEKWIFSSRWWSRGWTLQELIAPESVGFFDKNWSFIGNKVLLAGDIARETGIDKDILTKRRKLDSATTAQKMAWASSRETTREEDMAYCLFGLFGVNMPLLYGEGANAFQRLQEAILAVTDDESILAWADASADDASSGPLAPHPSTFRSSQDLLRYFNNPDSDVSDWKMTNRGLRLKLPILACPQGHPLHGTDVVLGLLNCSRSGDYSGPAAIRLRKVAHATYIRVGNRGIKSADAATERNSAYEVVPYSVAKHAISGVIFIKKADTRESVHTKRQYAYYVRGNWLEHGARLDHVWPPEHWDPARMIIQKSCVVAVLIFVLQHDANHTNSTTATLSTTRFAVLVRPSNCDILREEEISMTSNPTMQDNAMSLQSEHATQCEVASPNSGLSGAVIHARQCGEDPHIGESKVPITSLNYEMLASLLRPSSIAEGGPRSLCRKQVMPEWDLVVSVKLEEIMGATMFVVDMQFSRILPRLAPTPSSSSPLPRARPSAAGKVRQLYDLAASKLLLRRTRHDEYEAFAYHPAFEEMYPRPPARMEID